MKKKGKWREKEKEEMEPRVVAAVKPQVPYVALPGSSPKSWSPLLCCEILRDFGG